MDASLKPAAPLSEDEAVRRFFLAWQQIRRGEIVRGLTQRTLTDVDSDLTTSEADILMELNFHPKGCGLGDLAKLVLNDPGNTARTAGYLVSKGLLKKSGAKDGRMVVVSFTPAGRTLGKKMLRRRNEIFRALFAKNSQTERDGFITELEDMVERLKIFLRADGFVS